MCAQRRRLDGVEDVVGRAREQPAVRAVLLRADDDRARRRFIRRESYEARCLDAAERAVPERLYVAGAARRIVEVDGAAPRGLERGREYLTREARVEDVPALR